VTFVRCDANLPAGAAPAFKIDERTHAAHRHPRGHSPARLPPGCLPGKALLLHVAEQQTRGEKEQRGERGGQERERSHFEYPRISCGPTLLPSALGRLFLIEGASVIADIPLRQLASRDDAPKPRLLTVFS